MSPSVSQVTLPPTVKTVTGKTLPATASRPQLPMRVCDLNDEAVGE